MLSDTSPEMEKVWIQMWRDKTPEFRLQRTFALSDQVITRSRAAIRRLHPEWTDLQCQLFWVEVHYGRDLAQRLRTHLDTCHAKSAA